MGHFTYIINRVILYYNLFIFYIVIVYFICSSKFTNQWCNIYYPVRIARARCLVKVNINKKSDLLYHVVIWRTKIEANPEHISYQNEKLHHHTENKPIMPQLRNFLSLFFTINRGSDHNDLTRWNSNNWRQLGSLQGSRRENFHHWELFSSALFKVFHMYNFLNSFATIIMYISC
jgi:hypothetical protein